MGLMDGDVSMLFTKRSMPRQALPTLLKELKGTLSYHLQTWNASAAPVVAHEPTRVSPT